MVWFQREACGVYWLTSSDLHLVVEEVSFPYICRSLHWSLWTFFTEDIFRHQGSKSTGVSKNINSGFGFITFLTNSGHTPSTDKTRTLDLAQRWTVAIIISYTWAFPAGSITATPHSLYITLECPLFKTRRAYTVLQGAYPSCYSSCHVTQWCNSLASFSRHT